MGRSVSLAGQELWSCLGCALVCILFVGGGRGVCFQIKIKLQKRCDWTGTRKMPWWMPKALVEMTG